MHQSIRPRESFRAIWLQYCLFPFFQHCWSILKWDIMSFFTEFHERGTFEKSLDATFISSLPKVARADDITKFRPISLVGSVCKILAKVLLSLRPS